MRRSGEGGVFISFDDRRSALRLVARDAPPPAPVRARDIRLSREDTLEDAAVAILSSALDQFVGNAPALRATGAPESVHQMRVGLRRLRAALGMLQTTLIGPELTRARTRAKALADVLGEARDWDVFREMLDAGPRDAMGDSASFFALIDAVELRRAAAYRAALAQLDARETAQFVSDLRRALATRDWRVGDDEMRAPGAARVFAAAALTRLRKRALKRSHGLATLSAAERHQARIALKKARYGAEFFHSLFAREGRARAYYRALAKMQDEMGVFNDMETANRLLDAIDAQGDAHVLAASGFVRGWFAHAAQAGAAHAEASESRLKALKPFWA